MTIFNRKRRFFNDSSIENEDFSIENRWFCRMVRCFSTLAREYPVYTGNPITTRLSRDAESEISWQNSSFKTQIRHFQYKFIKLNLNVLQVAPADPRLAVSKVQKRQTMSRKRVLFGLFWVYFGWKLLVWAAITRGLALHKAVPPHNNWIQASETEKSPVNAKRL